MEQTGINVSRSSNLFRVAAASLMLGTLLGSRPASAVNLNKHSASHPGLAAFNGKLYIAFTGTDGQLNVASSTDGLTFGANTVLSGTNSYRGTALAAFNGQLYLVYVGTDSNHMINYYTSTDGVNWGNKTLFNNYSSTSTPAVAASSNQLIIAWNGTDNNHSLNIGCIVCVAQGFGTKQTYTEGSPSGVAIASIGDRFYVAYQRNTDHAITLMGSSASNPLTLNQASAPTSSSDVGPGMGAVDDYIYIGWPGPEGSQTLKLGRYLYSASGGLSSYQSEDFPSGQTSARNPAIASFNGHLYYAWLGANNYLNIEQRL